MFSKSNRSSKKILENKKILIISITVFIIIFLICYAYIRNQNNNYNNIKKDKDNYLVYTKYEKTNGNYSIIVPYINIKSEGAEAVNQDIDLFLSDFISSTKTSITYEYNINGIFLSVVVKVIDYDTEYAPNPYFRTYNFNLNTSEVIADEALLNFFGVNEDYVKEKIEYQFQYYYENIVKEEYYCEEECNYDCFLKYRGISDYLDNVNYYISDGNLIAYIPFTFYSIFGEEEYFTEKHFEFLLVSQVKE
jgi:hypothetical protein